MKATARDSRRLDLDVIRGVAILLALGWHFNGKDTGWLAVDLLQLPGRTIGWAGVDLFFVLSGFLVGGLIFKEFRDAHGFEARRFLIRRAFKIWPVLYAYVALLVLTGRYQWHAVLPQTLLHVQNYFPTPLNHLWSLAVEEHFYLIFAVAFSYFVQRSNRRIDGLPKVLIGLMVSVLSLRLLAGMAGVAVEALHIQTHFRIDALACGVLLAYLNAFRPDIFGRLQRAVGLQLIIIVVGITSLIVGWEHKIFIGTLGYTVSYVCGAALFLLIYDRTGQSLLVKALGWLGGYSYAMYVFQFVFIRAAEAGWARLGWPSMSNLTALLVSYAGAVLTAVVVTKLLEHPMLRLRARLFP